MDGTDLAFAGLARQAELVAAGEVSSRELVDLYLERIERIDPELNSFRVVFAERARAEADQADARRRSGDNRPLLGVPVAIKDNFDVAGETTTHGSSTYGGPAEADAEIVTRLRAAGAVLIGKTHLPELAIFPWTESQAWGATRNPWNLERSTGGSSGGSGAAVAAGLVPAALASDGGGSIRIPAACCGLYGLKPQRGRVSLMPYPQHWHGLSVAGCLSRSVADTALWLDVVSGPAPGDADVARPPDGSFADAARRSPGKLRIAISTKPSQPARVNKEIRQAVHDTADLLRSLGHEVTEQDPEYGFALPYFFPRWTSGIREDALAMPDPEKLEKATRQLSGLGKLFGPGVVARTRAREAAFAKRVGQVWEDHDVLITPTVAQLPWKVGKAEGKGWLLATNIAAGLVPFTTVWNVTGQPAASVPAGFSSDGLPLAVQLIGRPHDEATLLSLSAQIEAERPWAAARPALAA